MLATSGNALTSESKSCGGFAALRVDNLQTVWEWRTMPGPGSKMRWFVLWYIWYRRLHLKTSRLDVCQKVGSRGVRVRWYSSSTKILVEMMKNHRNIVPAYICNVLISPRKNRNTTRIHVIVVATHYELVTSTKWVPSSFQEFHTSSKLRPLVCV